MIEDNRKSVRVRAQDSVTTQHLKEAVAQEPLTVTTAHIKEALAAEALTTAHLRQTLHDATAEDLQVNSDLSPQGEMHISSAKRNGK